MATAANYETRCPICPSRRIKYLPVDLAEAATTLRINGKVAVVCTGCRGTPVGKRYRHIGGVVQEPLGTYRHVSPISAGKGDRT